MPIHSTRLIHAVMLPKAAEETKYVYGRLSHANYQITADIYRHVSKKLKERSINKFDE